MGYNKLISEAAASRSRLEHEEGVALNAISAKDNKIEIVSVISTDPDGESQIWDSPAKERLLIFRLLRIRTGRPKSNILSKRLP